MVGRTVCAPGTEYFEPAAAQSVKCLRACDLVTVMAVDIKLGRTVVDFCNDVAVPNFIK